MMRELIATTGDWYEVYLQVVPLEDRGQSYRWELSFEFQGSATDQPSFNPAKYAITIEDEEAGFILRQVVGAEESDP